MKHVRYECKCDEQYCQFCDGGLFHCTVCHGFEGSLPTDCPGARMNEVQVDDVYAGRIDYRDGRVWVVPDGTGNSMGDVDKIVEQRKSQVE